MQKQIQKMDYLFNADKGGGWVTDNLIHGPFFHFFSADTRLAVTALGRAGHCS